MKKLYFILFIVLLNTGASYSQNYQCLQYGVNHYFINSNGYLRGIKIDSLSQSGDTSIYYPFHTLRGNYGTPMSVLDSNGGSWLGKKVLQLSDGTFIFDNEWTDSLIIKTQAQPGDTWTFYKDSSPVYYKASFLAYDTMTVLGTLDSIKKIIINAYDSSGIISTDPLDSFQLIISKNYGLVQAFDLYTFPYHIPGGAYVPGIDFFLDKSTVLYTHVYGYGGFPPNKNISTFTLIDLINPTGLQLYIPHAGNIFEYQICAAFDQQDCSHSYSYSLDSSAIVTINGSAILLDTVFMPEQFHQDHFFYYHPFDTSYCMLSPSYEIIPTYLNGAHAPYYFEGPIREDAFKIGLGHVYSYYIVADVHYYDIYSTELIYYDVGIYNGNLICGSFHPLSVANTKSVLGKITVYPNPLTDELTIEGAEQGTTVNIYNIIDQQLYSATINQKVQRINTSSFSEGTYILELISPDGHRQINKIVK